MAAKKIEFEMVCANGRPVAAISNVIAQRIKLLKEDTINATVATAIDVVKSLKNQTRVAKPKRDSGFATVGLANGVFVKWHKVGARAERMVTRDGKNKVATALDLAGKYRKGEKPQAYLVIDRFSKDIKGDEKRYFVIANDIETVMMVARDRHTRRVIAHAGLAKATLGRVAMKISTKARSEVKSNASVAKLARKNAIVTKSIQGFDSGRVMINILDKLNYSKKALKEGEQSINLALMKAANKISGMIRNKWSSDMKIDSSYSGVMTPFPEIVQ